MMKAGNAGNKKPPFETNHPVFKLARYCAKCGSQLKAMHGILKEDLTFCNYDCYAAYKLGDVKCQT